MSQFAGFGSAGTSAVSPLNHRPHGLPPTWTRSGVALGARRDLQTQTTVARAAVSRTMLSMPQLPQLPLRSRRGTKVTLSARRSSEQIRTAVDFDSFQPGPPRTAAPRRASTADKRANRHGVSGQPREPLGRPLSGATARLRETRLVTGRLRTRPCNLPRSRVHTPPRQPNCLNRYHGRATTARKDRNLRGK
jgi:hypothetical protein